MRFFASRLKYSRLVRVSLVKDETVETLVRSLAEHLDSWGGAPLMCVFDRPKTVAIHWKNDGEVTEWNSTLAYAALELGVGDGVADVGHVLVALAWFDDADRAGAAPSPPRSPPAAGPARADPPRPPARRPSPAIGPRARRGP